MIVLRVKLGSKFFQSRLSTGFCHDVVLFGRGADQGLRTDDVQTTTLTISNTVQAAGIDRPGINLGGLTATDRNSSSSR